jgi:dephospho-CoA kinase
MSSDGPRKHRVLLGGGIGAGKSSVAALFVEAGFTHVESDRIGADVLRPGTVATGDVARAWPGVVHGGSIDRAALAAVVFSSKRELDRLEAITHPRIREEIQSAADDASGSVVVEVPLTTLNLEGDWTRVALLADEGTRVERAVARGGDPQDVRNRIRSQASDADWIEWADVVVNNNDGWAETERKFVALIDGLDS